MLFSCLLSSAKNKDLRRRNQGKGAYMKQTAVATNIGYCKLFLECGGRYWKTWRAWFPSDQNLESLQLVGGMKIKLFSKRERFKPKIWLKSYQMLWEQPTGCSSCTHPSPRARRSRCCSRFCRWRHTCRSRSHRRSRWIWAGYSQPVTNTFWTWNIENKCL